MEQYDEQHVADGAWNFLRSNSTVSLAFGENSRNVSYVIAPDGKMIIPAMVAMLQPSDIVMYIPEYLDDCMEMHVSLHQFTEEGDDGVLADRWRVYHGEPPDTQWAFVDIDAARFHEKFIDGEGLCRASPLAEMELSICKTLNINQDALRNVCKSKTNVEITNPFAVGVDPLGVDLRAPFGIVRIPAEKQFTSVEDVFLFFGI